MINVADVSTSSPTLLAALVAALLLCGTTRADSTVLRFATIVPDGTGPARELKAFAREVESVSGGELRIKLALGGIAGDEFGMIERVRRQQLDGLVGTVSCGRLAPSLRVLRIAGMIQSRHELLYLLGKLRPTLDEEYGRTGFVNLADVSVGPSVIFSRAPVHNLAELRKVRLWRWDLDEIGLAMSRQMGFDIVPLPIEQAAKAYDDGRVDGFIALPVAALAWQLSVRAKAVADLRTDYLVGCLVVATRTFDRLSFERRQQVRQAAAKLAVRINDVGSQSDSALLGGLFQRQGLTSVPVSVAFFGEFFAAARAARLQLDERIVPQALITEVQGLLADYRAEHRSEGREP